MMKFLLLTNLIQFQCPFRCISPRASRYHGQCWCHHIISSHRELRLEYSRPHLFVIYSNHDIAECVATFEGHFCDITSEISIGHGKVVKRYFTKGMLLSVDMFGRLGWCKYFVGKITECVCICK